MDGTQEQPDKLPEETIRKLIEECTKAKSNSWSPYSKFRVGCALLTTDGRIFTGCNVENSAYPLCTCAERCAIVKAVSEGCTKYAAIAVATDIESTFGSPCGGCRQIMAEFGLDYWVILTKPDGSYVELRVRELLPHSFSGADLRAGQSATSQ